MERQKRVQLNAAMIEARDRVVATHIEEPQVKGVMSTPYEPLETPNEQADQSRIDHGEDKEFSGSVGLGHADPRSNHTASSEPSPHAPQVKDEPHSWQPRTLRRLSK